MPEEINEIFTKPIVVINLGLENFARNLETQGVEVIRVDWKPPAGGNQEMIDILNQLL